MEQHFWPKVDIREPRECWEWQGYIRPNGYGGCSYAGKNIGTHRAAWIIAFGDIPKDMYVLHACHNRRCVNPNHLYLGTPADNRRDGVKGQKLSPSDVEHIRELIADRTITQQQIADMYGVSFWLIAGISQGKRWA